jgi:hypothetical protein
VGDILDLWPEKRPYSLLLDLQRFAIRIGANIVFTVPRLIGSIALLAAAMALGFIALSRNMKPFLSMIFGSIMICLTILAFVWGQYIAGPVYILCGALLIASAAGR